MDGDSNGNLAAKVRQQKRLDGFHISGIIEI